LVKNTTPDNIHEHEKKYGTYEEISQGIKIDRELMLSALISELKSVRLNISRPIVKALELIIADGGVDFQLRLYLNLLNKNFNG